MLVEHPVILPFMLKLRRYLALPLHFVKPGEDFSPYRKVIIPNGLWPSVKTATQSIDPDKRLFCEIGFLPQTENVYFDPHGVHGHSSIRTERLPDLGVEERNLLTRQREAFSRQNHVRVKWSSVDLTESDPGHVSNLYDFDFYFVPLQLTRDTAFELCPFANNQQIIDYIESTLPADRIVFKPHPLDATSQYRVKPTNILLPQENKDLRELLLRCQAVIASNSTVILEALMLGKRCATYGEGFSTNHRVTLECHDNLDRLTEIGNWQPETKRVERFLWLLLNRQVSVDFANSATEKAKLINLLTRFDVLAQKNAGTPTTQHSAKASTK